MRFVAIGGIALLLALCGCESTQPDSPTSKASIPSVLLVTLDTTRADRLGCYGHAAAHTPVLDELAASGTRFTRAYSPVPLTLPSHASLLSGVLPPSHGLHVNACGALPADVPTLTEPLVKSGRQTAAFISAWVLDSMFGLDRGFSHYDDDVRERVAGDVHSQERAADEVTDAALAWIARHSATPFFAWVHYFDPHHPYEPPAPFADTMPDPYDGEIAYMDQQIGRLLAGLPDRENTLIVVVGDHGEAFGEHGETTHGLFIYNTTLHIPMIWTWPGHIEPGVCAAPASLVDVLPTILDLLELDPPAGIQGRSLTAALSGGQSSPTPLYAESEYGRLGYGWASLRTLIDGRWKYIDAPRPELYDLESDFAETEDVLDTHPDVADRLRAALRSWHVDLPRRTVAPATLDADALRALESLGYVAAAQPTPSTPDDDTPRRDPKDMLHVLNGQNQARFLVQQRRFTEAIRVLEPLIEASPESDELHALLADAAFELGHFDVAEQGYRAALRRVPNDPRRLCKLGDALVRQERIPEAVESYQRCIASFPVYPMAHNRLGMVYVQRGDFAQAEPYFQRCVQLTPDAHEARYNLGFVLHRLQRDAEAIPHLRAAVTHTPDHALAQRTLARALINSGRSTEAIEALRSACVALPQDIMLKSHLAQLLCALRTPTAAREALELARICQAAEPDRPQHYEVLALCHQVLGNVPAARAALQRGLQLAQAKSNAAVAQRLEQRLRALPN